MRKMVLLSRFLSLCFLICFGASITSSSSAQEPEIFIHYLGHSSFVIYFDNGIQVLTDYGKSNSYGLPSPIYGIGNFIPDIITFSHKHEDHYDPSRLPNSVNYILTDYDTLSLAGLSIRPKRTSETSLAVKDNSSFIFTYKGFTLVHLGDAQANIMNIADQNNRNYLKQIFPKKIDLLLMPIQSISQFIPQAEEFIEFLQPRRMIPIHYWTTQYKADFLAHLENMNQTAGKNYQIQRLKTAKYVASPVDTNTTAIQIISLEPAPFSAFNQPEIWYDSHELDDSLGNNNGAADTGETVNLVIQFTNFWLDASNVSVTLKNSDTDIQIISGTMSYGDLPKDQSKSNPANPFTFSISSTATAHYSQFYLDISADGGYAKTDSFEIVIGTPEILFIDDDGGEDCETNYTNVMIPAIWEVHSKGCPTTEFLQQYKAVVWSTGDDRESSLTVAEQSVISDFLDNGGKLLITGQNIGYDLCGDGSASDSIFLSNYLHVKFVSDSTNGAAAVGVAGDPITGGMVIGITPTPAGQGNISSPDEIEAIAPAQLIFKFPPAMRGAGLRYENQTTGARLVYLAFGFEKIVAPQDKFCALVEKIFAWLIGSTPVANDRKSTNIPTMYALDQNHPNPFNSTTTIRYSIHKHSLVSLKLFNIMGKELATMVKQEKLPGNYSITFDGSSLSSGVYFYQLQAENFSHTRKMILLR